MPNVVVTQLIVSASGAQQGVREFEAAMDKAKRAAVEAGEATATSFERAQARWNASLAKTDPVIKAQIAMEKDLARQREIGANAVKLGIASQDAVAAQLSKVNQQHQAYISTLGNVSTATQKMAGQTGLARHELVNLSRQAQDVAVSLGSGQSFGTVLLQQGSQIGDVFASSQGTVKGFFGQLQSAAASVLTPLRLVAGGALAIGAAALYVGHSWSEGQAQIEKSLIGIGAKSGESVASINRFSVANASAIGLSVSQARDVAVEFTKTGSIAVSGLQGLGDAIHGYSVLTGEDATKATQDFAKAFSGDLSGALDLASSKYGVINSVIREQVHSLILAGDKTAAAQVIISAMAADNLKAAESVGFLTRAWNFLGNAIDRVKNLPALSPQLDPNQQLAQAKANQAAGSSQLGSNLGG